MRSLSRRINEWDVTEFADATAARCAIRRIVYTRFYSSISFFFLMLVAIERTGNKLEVMTFTLGL